MELLLMFGTTMLPKLALAIGLAAVALPASAGEVHNRVGDQQARINQGVKSGQMTRGEYDRSEDHLRAINAQRKADLRANGGHLTAGEHAKLNREMNRNSNRIYFDKHNVRTQP
jgi:hypothetical protein